MLGTVLSTVFQIVMICGMAAFHKRFPNDDPCTLVVSRSKWAGRGVCTMYLAYFLTVSFYVIGTFTYFMDYYFSDYIPRLMIVLSVAACGIYVAMSGLGVIGKTGTVLFVLFLFVTSILVISSLEDFTFVDFHLAEKETLERAFSFCCQRACKKLLSCSDSFSFTLNKGQCSKNVCVFSAHKACPC